jgi:plastocyanin
MRRSLVVVLSVFALTLLSACGGGENATSSNPPPAPNGGGHDDHGESSPAVEGARRIEVNATSFAFDPDEIEITAGEDVAIVLSSEDILHDFTVDGLDVHVAADRGETAEGGLRADEPGEYTYYCTIAGHRDAGMAGTLIVEAS